MKINLLYFKTYSYFDPIGFGCLTRGRQECEVYITKLEEQHGIPEINDQADVNQRQAQINTVKPLHCEHRRNRGKTFSIAGDHIRGVKKIK